MPLSRKNEFSCHQGFQISGLPWGKRTFSLPWFVDGFVEGLFTRSSTPTRRQRTRQAFQFLIQTSSHHCIGQHKKHTRCSKSCMFKTKTETKLRIEENSTRQYTKGGWWKNLNVKCVFRKTFWMFCGLRYISLLERCSVCDQFEFTTGLNEWSEVDNLRALETLAFDQSRYLRNQIIIWSVFHFYQRASNSKSISSFWTEHVEPCSNFSSGNNKHPSNPRVILILPVLSMIFPLTI